MGSDYSCYDDVYRIKIAAQELERRSVEDSSYEAITIMTYELHRLGKRLDDKKKLDALHREAIKIIAEFFESPSKVKLKLLESTADRLIDSVGNKRNNRSIAAGFFAVFFLVISSVFTLQRLAVAWLFSFFINTGFENILSIFNGYGAWGSRSEVEFNKKFKNLSSEAGLRIHALTAEVKEKETPTSTKPTTSRVNNYSDKAAFEALLRESVVVTSNSTTQAVPANDASVVITAIPLKPGA